MFAIPLTRNHLISLYIMDDLTSATSRKIFGTTHFQKALSQKHHNFTTVALHTLGVTVTSLRLFYFLEMFGIELDKEALMKSALCHDLGIIGRDEKFSTNAECCRNHPIDSAEIARDIFPDLDEVTEDSIRTHMWPACANAPSHAEGIIINIADKYCAVIEGIAGKHYCPGMPFIDFV